ESVVDSEYEHSVSQAALAKVYFKNVLEVVKLYGPSVTLGVVSISCIVGAHGIMRKRNVALVAAYKSVESAYSAYRDRVIETYGEEKDKEFRYDVRQNEIEDPETGKKTKVNSPTNPLKYSPYSRVFDRNNHNWSPNRENNLSF